MGRQICFFATPNDLLQIIQSITKYKCLLMNKNGVQSELDAVYEPLCAKYNDFGFEQYYIATTNSKISYGVNKMNEQYIDSSNSDVIEFLSCGRIPQTTIDREPVEKHFRRGDYVVVDDIFKYFQITEEYMKNPKYIDNPCFIENGFEHGRFYLDTTRAPISKETTTLYNALVRAVKKYGRLDKDKYAYILPDAYNLYLRGEYVPRSGIYNIIF